MAARPPSLLATRPRLVHVAALLPRPVPRVHPLREASQPVICALLCWYDESPAWLTTMVSALTKASVTHLVAVDGPYALYPGSGEQPHSPIDQAEAIVAAAYGAGIALTLTQPGVHTSEVAKRDHSFKLAHTLCQDGDWLYVIDADEVVTSAPSDLLERLDACPYELAQPTLYERLDDTYEDLYNPIEPVTRNYPRVLLRWTPDLRVEENHYTYRTDQLTLRGEPTKAQPLADGEILHDLRCLHRTKNRGAWRRQQQEAYYARREATGIEAARHDLEHA
jgi:hypothetical protein